jgi:predicted TPR repeat methyltransferase
VPAAQVEGQGAALVSAGLTGPVEGTASAVEAANLCTIGRAALVHGKLKAAATCFERALALTPDSPEAVWGLADALYALGREARALEQYRRFLALRPNSAEGRHIVAALGGAPSADRAPDAYVVSVFDHYAEDFDRSLIEDLHYCGPDALRAAVDAVMPGAQGLDIADVGCGTGLSGLAFRSAARTLAGVDLSAEMLKRAEARGIYDTVTREEMTAFLAARRDEFDLIVAVDSFCYVGDLTPVFRAAAGALKPEGLLAFSVEHRRGRSWRLTGSGRYAHSPDWLRRCAREEGLAEVSGRIQVLRLEYGAPVEGYVSVMRRMV